LILSSDDLVTSRDLETFSPRDNVIFELGLFMGRLGRSRTFIVCQHNTAIKIPTDLSGVTTATYEWPREDGSHEGALGAACDKIRKVIRELGVSEAKTDKAIRNIESRQVEQEQHLARQEAELRAIQTLHKVNIQEKEIAWIKTLIRLIVPDSTRANLERFAGDGPFMENIEPGSGFELELRHLLSLQLIDRVPGKGMRTLLAFHGNQNVKDHFSITPLGHEYLLLFKEATSLRSDTP